MMIDKPKVSVCMTTYCHKKYISQAIDSVLKQKVNFFYEICISDDASCDGTVDILKEYARKYDFIKININDVNLGLTKNFYKAYSMCSGKYIVDLSGDDYYIDELKLQKQYDYLENNGDVIGVATAIESRFDDEDARQNIYPSKRYLGRLFTLKDFMKGFNIPLNGLMVKNYWIDEDDKKEMEILVNASDYIDDITMSIKYLQKGNIFVLPDVCTVYRIHRSSEGNTNFNSINKGMLSFKKHIQNLVYLDGNIPNLDFYSRFKIVTEIGYLNSIRFKKNKEFYEIYREIPQKYRKRGMLLKIMLLLPFKIPYYLKLFLNKRK